MDDSRWHILRVKSGSEQEVASTCGYPAYVPRQRVRSFNRRSRRIIERMATLLPGFVFINIEEPADFSAPPCSHRLGFLRNGDRSPARLSFGEYALLRHVEQEKTAPFTEEKSTRPTYKVGDQITIPLGGSNPVQALIREIRGDQFHTELVGTKLRMTFKGESALAA